MNNQLYKMCAMCGGTRVVPGATEPPISCPQCYGVGFQALPMTLEKLQQAIRDSQEAHLYYRADGTSSFFEDVNTVRSMRVDSAKKIIALTEACQKAGIPIPSET